MTDIIRSDAATLAAKIAIKEVSSAEITRACLDQIEATDETYHAFLHVAADEALAAAAAIDKQVAAGEPLPSALAGVPLALKDVFTTSDMPTTCGSKILEGWRSPYDATLTARLRAAGIPILGKTNMDEFAMGSSTENSAYGPTRNPWNLDRVPGGCGVATAAGLCFGSIGSDTGGSIRFPTSMCGVTGIKPTWGRVSRHGVVELAASYDHVGPITRSAHDAAVLLSVIAGSDIHDPSCSAEPVPDYAADLALTRIPRVGVDWSQTTSFDEDTTAMLADVVKTLDDIGWPVIDVKLPALAPMVAAFGKMRAVETAIAHADTYPARADEYGPIMRAMIDAGHRLAAVEYQTLTERRLEFTRSLRRVFHDVDILLMPSAGIASPTLETMRGLGQDPELTARLAMPTAPFNVSGNPAICLPAGTTARGTPLGVQFIGREFDEHLLVRAGHAFQQVTGYHRRRPPV